MKVRRISGYFCLAAFVVTLAVWPLSYFLTGFITGKGFALAVRAGGYYVAAGDIQPWIKLSFKVAKFDGVIIDSSDFGMPVERWKPVKLLPIKYFSVFVIAAWVLPLIFAYPAWRSVRRWRRQRIEPGRGFEVTRPA